MKIFFCLILLLIKKKIKSGKTPCFEYSCSECETQEYGKCTKCREGWKLIDGLCPCSDSSCALCSSGLAGLHLCLLCKNGYYRFNGDCYCTINNCEQCGDNTCLKCISGYFYNNTSNSCEKQKDEDKVSCHDNNCDICYSSEKGACENCKNGFIEKKGECYELPIPDENLTCPDNYYLSGNNCLEKCSGVSCPDNYMSYPDYYTCPSNKCLICVNNELKLWSECDNSNECSLMEGCLNCITNDECVVCSQGYYLLGGECKKCIDGCSICSNNETCDYCISGYILNSEKQCNLTNNFDFNSDTYSYFKTILIEIFHPEEIPKTTQPTIISTEETTISSQAQTTQTIIQSTIPIEPETAEETIPPTLPKVPNNALIDLSKFLTCDEYCTKCYDNTEICIECKESFMLKDNKCIKCKDEKCLDCFLENNVEHCKQCKIGYSPNKEKCNLICSDQNCLKCSNNKDYCSQCKAGFKIKNGECIKSCEVEYCQVCSDDGKNCTDCEEGKKLFEGKCAQQSNFCSQHLQYCNLCFKPEKCEECLNGYVLDETGKCKKNANYISIIFTILGIGIIIIGILSYCIYKKRKNELRNEIRRIRHNQESPNNIHIYRDRTRNNLDVSGSSRSVLSKEELAEEFEKQKRKMEKGNQMCQFCKKKPGKFKCDCGCIVCKVHSSLKNMEGDGENYKVCYVCEKIVKKVSAIKYKCNICFIDKLSVVHFKCGCALEVCKTCYIKCKMENNKCPGCRALI